MEVQARDTYIGIEEEGEDNPEDSQTQTSEGQ
jgi:hypothetical protein